MNSIFWEIQPTDKGNEVSWWNFLFKKMVPASKSEIKFGFTVQITDAISNILVVGKSLDPLCETSIYNRSGVMFPNFELRISSKKFEVTAEKIFAGGSSRENLFNYRVDILVQSFSAEIIKQFQEIYNGLWPKPLRETMVLEDSYNQKQILELQGMGKWDGKLDNMRSLRGT